MKRGNRTAAQLARRGNHLVSVSIEDFRHDDCGGDGAAFQANATRLGKAGLAHFATGDMRTVQQSVARFMAQHEREATPPTRAETPDDEDGDRCPLREILEQPPTEKVESGASIR